MQVRKSINMDVKILSNFLASWMNLPMYKDDQVGFTSGMQSWLNIRKINCYNSYFNRLKKKILWFIFIHSEQLSDKIKHPFVIDILSNRELPKLIQIFLIFKK